MNAVGLNGKYVTFAVTVTCKRSLKQSVMALPNAPWRVGSACCVNGSVNNNLGKDPVGQTKDSSKCRVVSAITTVLGGILRIGM